MSFNVGDVVRLKSGGPAMTVVYTTEGNKVTVNWYNGSGFSQQVFPIAALDPVNPEDVG